jgi:hypothetical protein
MHPSTITTALLLVSTMSLSSTQAAVRWTAHRDDTGHIRFKVLDELTGQQAAIVLDPAHMRVDRPIQVAFDVDLDAGRQGLSLVWTDSAGQVQTDRIDLTNVVEGDFLIENLKFRVDPEQADPQRVDESMTDAIARFTVSVTGQSGELFSVRQTDHAQADPNLGVPGDVDADGVVRIQDILHIVSSWADVCVGDEDCPADIDGDGFVGVSDLLLVLRHLGETSAVADDGPSRLIHFQLVGGSFTDDANHIHPLIYNDDIGWQALIQNDLTQIESQAPEGWDLWLHNPGGYWYDHDYTWRSGAGQSQPMVFEQLEFARQQRPGLLELDPVRDWMNDHGGHMFGYVGLPRTFESEYWTTMPQHGQPEMVGRFYGDLLQQGFRGIGHDASVHHPEDSTWLNQMLPELRARGIEIFLESIPSRNSPWLLGQSVVAEHRLWLDFSGNHADLFYSPEEIEAAGGRAIHLVQWPLGMSPEDEGYDPTFNVHQWTYDTSLTLLEEGKTVAVCLSGLVRHGYNVAPLVAAAQ